MVFFGDSLHFLFQIVFFLYLAVILSTMVVNYSMKFLQEEVLDLRSVQYEFVQFFCCDETCKSI